MVQDTRVQEFFSERKFIPTKHGAADRQIASLGLGNVHCVYQLAVIQRYDVLIPKCTPCSMFMNHIGSNLPLFFSVGCV